MGVFIEAKTGQPSEKDHCGDTMSNSKKLLAISFVHQSSDCTFTDDTELHYLVTTRQVLFILSLRVEHPSESETSEGGNK